MDYQKRLLRAIPGGAHTYSRGFDQYPSNAPQILERGKGAYVYAPGGTKFLDYGMGLRAVNVGYSEPEIDQAAIAQIMNGNTLTRPSMIELEAAETLVDLIDSVDMVKFTKNGSTAVSAAVKLARAFTGKTLVARCAEHPFFSYDDWFIGSTNVKRGVPQETIDQTKMFHFNNIASLEALIAQYPGQFACVVLEPATTAHPAEGFLPAVQALCRKHGIVFVLDEMITGFRWHLKGAQHIYGIDPDLTTFGKAMANGFSVSCIAGKREIMELGAIEFEGRERVFLLSTTHGAEMSSLGAFVGTVKMLQREPVIDHLWSYGEALISSLNRIADSHGVAHSFSISGVPCSPVFATLDENGAPSMPLRTLLLQELIKNNVMMPTVALCYRHDQAELALTERAFDAALAVYAKALREGVDKYLVGPAVKPVFRTYN